MKKNKFIIIGLLIVLVSCENEVHIDVPDYNPQVVVEGEIFPGKGAEVLLTYTTPFFNDFDSLSLLEYRLTTAKVILSHNEEVEVMTLYKRTKNYPPYVYETNRIKGEIGGCYQLTVITHGDTLTSVTSIPNPIVTDSVWYENDTDSTFVLWLSFTDPPEKGNFYRTRTKVLTEDDNYVPTRISVYSDEYFNGEQLKITMSRGMSSIIETGEEKYFTQGVTVVLEFSTITKETYDFWNSYQTLMINSGNPFASPNTTLQGNVQGAIGLWGGYGARYDTIYSVK